MAFTTFTTRTLPESNVSGLCYVNDGGTKYLYYTTDRNYTKIKCADLATLTEQTSREINVQDVNDAQSYPCRGLATDGVYIFGIFGQGGHSFIHQYQFSATGGTYRGNHALAFSTDDDANGIEAYRSSGDDQWYIAVLRANRVVVYNVQYTLQSSRGFALNTNLGVTRSEWKNLCWDSDRQQFLLQGFGPDGIQTRAKLRAFSESGVHDTNSDLTFTQFTPEAMTYNDDDDNFLLANATATQLYTFGDAPFWDLSSLTQRQLTVTSTVDYVLNLSPLVDSGSVITAGNTYDTRSGLQGASLTANPAMGQPGHDSNFPAGNYLFKWSNPPAPTGGRHSQPLTLTFTATKGAHSTTQRITLTLDRDANPFIAASFGNNVIPKQVVYEPYTPPPGAPAPSVNHGFHLNLSGYLAQGRQPVTYSAGYAPGQPQIPGRFQITQRFANGVPTRDVLTYNSGTVDTSLEDGQIQVTAGNLDDDDVRHTGTAIVHVEIINLIYPTFHGSQDLDISDTATHSFDIFRDYLTAEPQPSLGFVGDVPSTLDAHLTGGILSIRYNMAALPANAALTVELEIAAASILTVPAGVTRRFNVNIAQREAPQTIPVIHGNMTHIAIDSEATLSVPLDPYIQSANPTPTFTVSDASEFTDLGGTARIDGRNLVVTAPTITVDLSRDIQVTARNDAGAVAFELTFDIAAIARAHFATNIPHQTIRPGETWTLDLNNFVTGSPTPTISFDPAPTGGDNNGENATLTMGVVSWAVPNTITADKTVSFSFQASNPPGTDNLSVGVAVLTDVDPQWSSEDINITVIEGETVSTDLTRYIEAGRPTPTLSLGTDASDLPLTINFNGYTMTIQPHITTADPIMYQFSVILGNKAGSQSKDINLSVRPVFVDSDNIRFYTEDYEEIRRLVDTTIERQTIPDEIIASDSIIGGAVAWGIERMPIFPDYPRTLEELTNKRRAMIYRAAGLLSAGVRRETDPRFTTIEVDEFQLQMNLFMRAEEFANLAMERFDELGLTEESLIDYIFDLVPTENSGWN